MGGKFSYSLVAIGSLFCWAFFPFLNIDTPIAFNYNYQAAISTFFCISASVLTCTGLSALISGQLNLNDIVYSPVVGGVVVGSSAAVMHNSGMAITLGIFAGCIHVLFQRW